MMMNDPPRMGPVPPLVQFEAAPSTATTSSDLPSWVVPLVVSLASLLALALILSAVIMCRMFDRMTTAIERLRNEQFFSNTFQRLRGTFGSRWSSRSGRTTDSRAAVAASSDKPTFNGSGPGLWRSSSSEEGIPLNDQEDQGTEDRRVGPARAGVEASESAAQCHRSHFVAVPSGDCEAPLQGEVLDPLLNSHQPLHQSDHLVHHAPPQQQPASRGQGQYVGYRDSEGHAQMRNGTENQHLGIDLGQGVYYNPPQNASNAPQRRSSLLAAETHYKAELEHQRQQHQQQQAQQQRRQLYQQQHGSEFDSGIHRSMFSQVGPRVPVSLDSAAIHVTQDTQQLFLADTIPEEVQRRVSDPMAHAPRAPKFGYPDPQATHANSAGPNTNKAAHMCRTPEKSSAPARTISLRRAGFLNRSHTTPKRNAGATRTLRKSGWQEGATDRNASHPQTAHWGATRAMRKSPSSPPIQFSQQESHYEEGYVYFTGTGISPVALVETDDVTSSSYPLISRPVTETVMRGGASLKQQQQPTLPPSRDSHGTGTSSLQARRDLASLDQQRRAYLDKQQQLSDENLKVNPRVSGSAAVERGYSVEPIGAPLHSWTTSHVDSQEHVPHMRRIRPQGQARATDREGQTSETAMASGQRPAPTLSRWPPPPPGPPPPAGWARAVAAGNGRPNVYVAPLSSSQNGRAAVRASYPQATYASARHGAPIIPTGPPPPLAAPVPRPGGRVESLYLP